MSLNTGIHLALHAFYFIIAALVGLFGYMPGWLRESLGVREGAGDVGLFIFIYIFLLMLEIIVENNLVRGFDPARFGKEMLQYVVAGFLTLGAFLVAGYFIGNSIKSPFIGYLVGLTIFIVADWVCRSIMTVLVTKAFTPRKRQVIR